MSPAQHALSASSSVKSMQSAGASALLSLMSAKPAAGLGHSADPGEAAGSAASDFAQALAGFMGLALGVTQQPATPPTGSAQAAVGQDQPGPAAGAAAIQPPAVAIPPPAAAKSEAGDSLAGEAQPPLIAGSDETPAAPPPGHAVRVLATAQAQQAADAAAFQNVDAGSPQAPPSEPAAGHAPAARAIEMLTARGAAAAVPPPAAHVVTAPAAESATPARPLSESLPAADPAAAVVAAATLAQPATRATNKEAASTGSGKRGEAEVKTGDGAKAVAPAGGVSAASVSKIPAGAPVAGQPDLPPDGEPALAAAPPGRDSDHPLPAPAVAHGLGVAAAHARPAPVTTPHTVAHLAAQIVQTAGGRTSRFDVQLDPAGLGKVDVQIEINARGEVSAALSFDNPQAAAELRARAGELTRALEQAGFDLAKNSLSFNLGGQGGGHQLAEQQHGGQPVWRGRAFAEAADAADLPPSLAHRTPLPGRIDVTV